MTAARDGNRKEENQRVGYKRSRVRLTLSFFIDVKTEADLFAPGADVGEVPTDFNQSTGLERLEILGKMQGVDIFDMKPLDASRKGMSMPWWLDT